MQSDVGRGISEDLSSSQHAIRTDDPHDCCIDDFKKGFRPPGEPTAFPIDLAIHPDEGFTGIGQLRLASDESHLSTIEDLDADHIVNGLLLDLPCIHGGHPRDYSERGPGEYDASDLVEPHSGQSNRERPAQHDCRVNMTHFSENKSRGCGEQLETCKRLSSGVEVAGERPPKRPRLDDYPTLSDIGAAEDHHDDYLKLVDVISTVPIDSPTIPAGDDHQIAASKIDHAVHQCDNTSMDDQLADHTYSSASSKPPGLPDTSPGCDERPAKTASFRDVDLAHQRRRSTRCKLADPNSKGASSMSITPLYAKARSAKQTKKRRRALKKIRTTNTTSRRDEDTFTTLRSQFLSSSFEVRLQLVSWLFEAALPRCMHDSEDTTGTTRVVGGESDEEEWEGGGNSGRASFPRKAPISGAVERM